MKSDSQLTRSGVGKLPALEDSKAWTSTKVSFATNLSARKALSGRDCKVYSHLFDNVKKPKPPRRFQASSMTDSSLNSKSLLSSLTPRTGKKRHVAQGSLAASLSTPFHRTLISQGQNRKQSIFPSFSQSARLSATERVLRRISFFRDNPQELARIRDRARSMEAEQRTQSNAILNRKLQLRQMFLEQAKENCSPLALVAPFSSRSEVAARRRMTVKITNKRRHAVKERRKQLVEKRLKALINSSRKRELRKKAALEKQAKVARALTGAKLLYLFARLQVIAHRFKQHLGEGQKKRMLTHNALIIQRLWKQNKAVEYGRKYRDAVLKVREFVISAKFNLRHKRQRRYANMVFWVLAEIETSNFQRVVKNYRQKVVLCQQFYRSYALTTKIRLRSLTILFMRAEKDLIREEQRIEFENKIQREIIAAVDIFGEAEIRAQLQKLLTISGSSQAGMGRKAQRYAIQVSERMNTLRNMPFVFELLCPRKRESYVKQNPLVEQDDDTPGHRNPSGKELVGWQTATAAKLFKRSGSVPRELVFKLVLNHIHQFVFQSSHFEVQKPRKELLRLANYTVEESSAMEDPQWNRPQENNRKVSNWIRLQVLSEYLQERRAVFKQAYAKSRRERHYAKVLGNRLTKKDIKDIMKAHTDKATKYMLCKKFNLVSTSKRGKKDTGTGDPMVGNDFLSELFLKIYTFEEAQHSLKSLVLKARQEMNSQQQYSSPFNPSLTETMQQPAVTRMLSIGTDFSLQSKGSIHF